MGKEIAWTEEQEEYLRQLYSEDSMITDIPGAFNEHFGMERSRTSIFRKAQKLSLSSGFSKGSKYNEIIHTRAKQERLGEIRNNKTGDQMMVVEYNTGNDIFVEFLDDMHYKVHTTYIAFKKGTVKNPGYKSMFGRGYLGQGQYKTFHKVNGKKTATKAMDAWRRMFDRCYNPKYLEKSPTYMGCEVCEEWCDFQNFAKWFYDNYYKIDNFKMEVDKDWLVVGNKIYGPENCCISPSIINTCMSCHDKLVNFDLPIGISHTRSGRYKARCSVEGKRKDLGTYDTIKEAEDAYWKFKIKYIESLASKYKEYIPDNLYNAMLDFKNTYKERYKQYMKGEWYTNVE